MDKNEVIEGILFLLRSTRDSGDELGRTFLEIKKYLKMNKVNGYTDDDDSDSLNEMLEEIEKEGLIEERHFGEIIESKVDYTIEDAGVELIEKAEKKGKKLGLKWDVDI